MQAATTRPFDDSFIIHTIWSFFLVLLGVSHIIEDLGGVLGNIAALNKRLTTVHDQMADHSQTVDRQIHSVTRQAFETVRADPVLSREWLDAIKGWMIRCPRSPGASRRPWWPPRCTGVKAPDRAELPFDGESLRYAGVRGDGLAALDGGTFIHGRVGGVVTCRA